MLILQSSALSYRIGRIGSEGAQKYRVRFRQRLPRRRAADHERSGATARSTARPKMSVSTW